MDGRVAEGGVGQYLGHGLDPQSRFGLWGVRGLVCPRGGLRFQLRWCPGGGPWLVLLLNLGGESGVRPGRAGASPPLFERDVAQWAAVQPCVDKVVSPWGRSPADVDMDLKTA